MGEIIFKARSMGATLALKKGVKKAEHTYVLCHISTLVKQQNRIKMVDFFVLQTTDAPTLII